jgi:hypothetical protein
MKRAVSFCLALFLVIGLILPAAGQTPYENSPSQAGHTPSGGTMLVDGVIVRPVGVVAIALGFVGTVITLPFTIPTGNVNAVAQKLIGEPFAFTFTRPLGVFPGSESLD